ncbi:MAG TPA: metalloregulator ArsR/SmtB family transcription factor [Acetobacteraceae bacterium]|nr:metalloregulator ArsR/SmtB family transcription factor [Acetobacteraceae bacterium]
MDRLLAALAAAADPTRLRLLSLAAGGAFCVNDFCDILGQSQPRLSRHLRLLHEAGLLERTREGVNAWYVLAQGELGGLVRDLLRRADPGDPVLAADRRGAARVLAERAREASEKFRRAGADWDEMRALDLPAAAVEAELLRLLGAGKLGRALDIGTGTGRLLEVLAPRIATGLGIDASRAMLALARVRLAKPEFSHCSVRLADMYALPLHDASFDLVLLQMVLHYAEDPTAAVAEARRVLAPGGLLAVVDFAPHDRAELRDRMAHRALGFSDADMSALLRDVAVPVTHTASVAGPLTVRIWCGRTAAAGAPVHADRFEAAL